MKTPSTGAGVQPLTASAAEEKKSIINTELWQACAGPLVNLPAAGTHVVYFPQGHSEQVAASLKKDVDGQVPNYPNLPSKLLCLLHSVTLHADPETDEVYAKMTLQPVPSFDKEALLRSDLSMKTHKPQTEFFCKTLTASDTSSHGGFSVPRRAAEKIFPQLDFTMQPPAQELVARDLHDNVWTFRHIYRGQPKRHLLTTGWSLFVGGKRLFAGDSVLFIRDEKQQLLLGIRRANRQQSNLSSSVLSSDSMHIGILAAAAHAAANNSPFTVFYNPRASPSEFVIPLAKYYKAVCGNQISLGMRFRMMFETEESGTRRYMGTITGISDLDPVRWKNSQWRNLQVGWDESTAGERRNRVSVWEIEPVTAPFFICPTPPFFRSKCPRQPGMPDDDSDLDSTFRRTMPWLGDEFGLKDPGLSLVQWMNMQQSSSLVNPLQPNYLNPMSGSVLQNLTGSGISGQLGLPSTQIPLQNTNMQFNPQRPNPPIQQIDQLQKLSSSSSSSLSPLGSVLQSQQQPMITQTLASTSNIQAQVLQPQNGVAQAPNVVHQQQQQSIVSHQQQMQRNVAQNLTQQTQILSQVQNQNPMPYSQSSDHMNQQLHVTESQIQLQLLQKLHHQQQSLLGQQSIMQQPSQLQDLQQKQLLDATSNFHRSMTMATNQMIDSSQATSSSMVSQPQVLAQQISANNLSFAQPKLQQQPETSGHVRHNSLNPTNNQLSAGGGNYLPSEARNNGGPSVVTDDIPSCSTSPSTNNCSNQNQLMKNGRSNHRVTMIADEVAQSTASLLNSGELEAMACNGKLSKDAPPKADVNPSLNISKGHNNGFFPSQQYSHANGVQIDYLDSSSSATSVLSQNEIQIPTTQNNSMTFNSQSMLFRDSSQDIEVHDDLRSNLPFGANIDNHFGMPMVNDPLTTKNMMGSDRDFPSNNISSGGGVLSGYENTKEAQAELSSSMISQSFGVPEMGFNSIDSTMNEGSFMNNGPWAPPQMPRLRTYTKVYKRGAVGRSIDITRYSGYDELKQDLARRFGIEGQLEDRQRIGWKLVYVDHESDVLLVGDDPWEEFVNCVRCIKILSPQEVQQMSLDGDFGNSLLQNQACSSSDNGIN